MARGGCQKLWLLLVAGIPVQQEPGINPAALEVKPQPQQQ